MILRTHGVLRVLARVVVCLALNSIAQASPASLDTAPISRRPGAAPKKSAILYDSLNFPPQKDLPLAADGERKAQALGHYVEGTSFEEAGEMDKALDAYRKVLDVDPGQAELAVRVAALLARQEDFPQAIDVLKDVIKVRPKIAEPYLQLAFIYAKYLKKTTEAVDYANQAIALDAKNIDAYQRLYEIELAAGDEKKALQSLDRARKVTTDDASFWARLGRLYASIILQPDAKPSPDRLGIVNDIFRRAAEKAAEDPTLLKEVADYYASTQQIAEAIPLYLRVLELQPEDATVREKLATGFVLTNQRGRAIETLDAIVKDHPEKYQPYELLAQLHDDEGRSLARDHQTEKAKAEFQKAASNYEHSLLVNPARATTYLRLAELLVGPLRDSERAVKLLTDARQHYANAPEFSYLLALALRESKRPQEAVASFEEALREAENVADEVLNARFFLEYGATAEQAGFYDKAADLFRKSIALDPQNAAEAYNYLGYMWAEQNIHLDEAEDMIKRALQLDPDNGAYLDSLGWIEFREGKYDQSLSDLLRAAQNIKRDDATVFEHIGDACGKLNRIAQAIEYWQKAQALDPKKSGLAEKIENSKTKISKGDRPNPRQ